MKIKFFGAVGTVTGSSSLLQGSGGDLLVDMGMFQGGESEEEMNWVAPKIDGSKLAGMVLTHAHLDHCGRLPMILSLGYKGKFYMTRATRDLMEIVLLDTVKIAENSGGGLYSGADVEQVLARVRTVGFGEVVRVGGMKIRLVKAGHILGSASLIVKDEKEGKTVVFSGDLGTGESPLINDPVVPEKADLVVMESTYGNRLHEDVNEEETLEKEMRKVMRNKGALLVPTFSIQRTQRVLYRLGVLSRQGRIPRGMKVYLDSPMAIRATRVFRKNAGLYSSEMRGKLKGADPFSFPELVVTEKSWESKKISKNDGAKMIVAGSGMMTGGRILSHAKRYLGRKSTIVFFVGYQAEGSLGRKILEGAGKVRIDGKEIVVRAGVSEVSSMSAHADQKQLMDWLKGIKGVKKVVLNHGENDAREVLAGKIRREIKGVSVVMPGFEEEVKL